jgi:hypothetical protein
VVDLPAGHVVDAMALVPTASTLSPGPPPRTACPAWSSASDDTTPAPLRARRAPTPRCGASRAAPSR